MLDLGREKEREKWEGEKLREVISYFSEFTVMSFI